MNIITLLLSFLTLMSPTEKKSFPPSGIEIPAIFSDNMVLQQKSDAVFWGKAEPNQKVEVKGSWGKSGSTIVNADGSWIVKIKTPKAGGPFDVKLTIGDSTITYKNVLTGEVWLCSGQSNMEMPLRGWPPSDTIFTSKETIKNSTNSKIRVFTVTRAFSTEKETNCEGSWLESNPETAGGFSATAYFFGKKLYDELKVPVGLIHTSWGGTPVEAWISKENLSKYSEFKSTFEDLKDASKDLKIYNDWLYNHPFIDVVNKPVDTKWKGLDFQDAKLKDVDFDDNNWKEMELPTLWENAGIGNFDGVIWFRKKVEIPSEWVNKDLILNLGPIDDMDITYVNGNRVGSYEADGFWQADRIYKIPKEFVQSSKLVIAVRVVDTQGGGGIYGAKEKMKVHLFDRFENVPLSGTWKYFPVAEYRSQKFFVFSTDKEDYSSRPPLKIDVSAYSPTTLYNAMINPLVPYSIKGAIWYQGEANVGNADLYTRLLPEMIQNWRTVWNEGDFPFYYVQIAPFDYGENSHSELLRESQLKTLSVKNTGMAVTMDIGNPKNIHPGNKKDVGERLAAWALTKDYKKKIPFSGPIYETMKIEGDKAILSFDHAKSGLVIKEIDGQNNFWVAGEDKVFKKAVVKADGKKLVVSSPEVKNPTAVRYAWDNISMGTLFNKDGLPASSFRTDEWK